jgi:hypothetical protein
LCFLRWFFDQLYYDTFFLKDSIALILIVLNNF